MTAAVFFAPALTASASAVAWSAEFIDHSAYPAPLESGESTELWINYRNSGEGSWVTGPVRIGTLRAPTGAGGAPENAPSPFHVPGSWIDPARPATVSPGDSPVMPGEITTFRWSIKAPLVGSDTVFQMPIGLVHENVAWMLTPPAVYWMITVRPSVPPAVALASAPDRVTAGQGIPVAIDARDNVRIASATVSIGDRSIEATRSQTNEALFTATIPTDGLPAGLTTVRAEAVDGAGNRSVDSHNLLIDVPAAPPPPTQVQTPAPVVPSPPAVRTIRRLVADVVASARVVGSRLRFKHLTVAAPVGARIEVGCSRRACAKTIVKRTRRPRMNVRLKKAKLMRPGVSVTVRVTKRGLAGRLTTFRVFKGGVRKTEASLPVAP